MSAGSGFQFTPYGIFPLGVPVPTAGDEVMGATAAVETTEAPEPPASSAQKSSAPALRFDPGKPLTGKQIAAMARARIRELDAILRTVPALQAERSSLATLLLAAKTPRKRKGIQ